jgi:hypothetical protein
MFSKNPPVTVCLGQTAAFQTWKSSPHSILSLFEVVPRSPKYIQFLLIVSALDDEKHFDHQTILEVTFEIQVLG